MSKMVIKMKNHGSIEIELFEQLAPLAVKSIKHFIANHKYDNHEIERLEPGFVIQPMFNDVGDFANLIDPEFLTIPQNHNYKFKKGTVAMAGTKDQSSDSQFFITLGPRDYLNGAFTVIGEVTDGWQEIERLENVDVIDLLDEASGYHYHKPVNCEIVETIELK